MASAETDPPRTIQWRRSADPPIYKSILRLDGSQRPDLIVGQGSHSIYTDENENRVPEIILPDLPLAHFPVRSRAQLTSKSVIGWAANLALDPNMAKVGMASQWKENFDAIERGEALTDEQLARASNFYATNGKERWRLVHDPMPFNYSRKYSDGLYAEPIMLIAQAWRKSLEATPTV